MSKMKPIKFELSIDAEHLAGVLEGAGSRYWCKRLDWEPYPEGWEYESCWHALLAGGLDHVDVYERSGEHGEDTGRKHRVTLESLQRGIQHVISKLPHHAGAVLGDQEKVDAETGDVLLQCAALGETVYG